MLEDAPADSTFNERDRLARMQELEQLTDIDLLAFFAQIGAREEQALLERRNEVAQRRVESARPWVRTDGSTDTVDIDVGAIGGSRA